MTEDELMDLATRHGHEVCFTDLSENKSISIEQGSCFIGIRNGLPPPEEKICLAHELGHCEYGGFYNYLSPYDIKAKSERRADKWSFLHLVPLESIIEAKNKGFTEIWELAEYFNVTCEFLQKALLYYCETLGITFQN